MAKKGLRSWVQENWVDIANKKSDGSYLKEWPFKGRKEKKLSKMRKSAIAKARAMSAKGSVRVPLQRKQAVAQYRT